MPSFKPTPDGNRLRQALDMIGTGMDIMRQNLTRKFPGESAAAIERRLRTWQRQRPGDAEGRPVDIDEWLRRRSKPRSK
jgi:hypothetical protein